MAIFKYRGRVITAEDILYIRELIAADPTASRRTLSKRLCEAWQWRQPNAARHGLPRIAADAGACRPDHPATGLLCAAQPAGERARPMPVLIDRTPIEGQLREIQPIELQQVRRTAEERLFNSLMEEHHYLGYEQPVGEHLKYLVWAQGRPIACVAWSSAPRHLGSRDRYIGWNAEARRRNIRFIAYNTRFLILPWFGCRTWPRTFSGR